MTPERWAQLASDAGLMRAVERTDRYRRERALTETERAAADICAAELQRRGYVVPLGSSIGDGGA
jgi:hypothetical protein